MFENLTQSDLLIKALIIGLLFYYYMTHNYSIIYLIIILLIFVF